MTPFLMLLTITALTVLCVRMDRKIRRAIRRREYLLRIQKRVF